MSTKATEALSKLIEFDPIAEAIAGVWYDGNSYWHQLPNGDWVAWSKDDIKLHFNVDTKLSSAKESGAASATERALYSAQRRAFVHGALPFIYQAPGITIKNGGRRYLNTFCGSVCAPAPEPQEWGVNFPWLGKFFTGYFEPEEQLDFFFAWLQRFYTGALERKMEKGQAIFIAGPPNQGKTLLSWKIIGGLMGTEPVDVACYLMDKTQFNSSLFSSAVWAIDDESVGKDQTAHKSFSNMVKKFAANHQFAFHKKFKDAATIDWKGRIIVTMNDDAESLEMLPEADINILDKICFFHTANQEHGFPVNVEELIHRELPFFARWLKDWPAPEHTRGSSRFGVKEYHAETLLEAAREQGRTQQFRELLGLFRKSWFTGNPEAGHWQGSSTELLKELLDDVGGLEKLARRYTPNGVGKEMHKLRKMNEPGIEYKRVKGDKIWRVLGNGFIEQGVDEKNHRHPKLPL